jgi:hypothetical protein
MVLLFSWVLLIQFTVRFLGGKNLMSKQEAAEDYFQKHMGDESKLAELRELIAFDRTCELDNPAVPSDLEDWKAARTRVTATQSFQYRLINGNY